MFSLSSALHRWLHCLLLPVWFSGSFDYTSPYTVRSCSLDVFFCCLYVVLLLKSLWWNFGCFLMFLKWMQWLTIFTVQMFVKARNNAEQRTKINLECDSQFGWIFFYKMWTITYLTDVCEKLFEGPYLNTGFIIIFKVNPFLSSF